jgi:hypothetical protein
MIWIGDREVIYTVTCIIPDNVEAKFNAPLSFGERLTLPPPTVNFSFIFKDEPSEQSTASWVAKENHITFTMHGWRNLLGTTLVEPMQVGELHGRPLSFVFTHHLIGQSSNLVTVQILLGREK